MNDLMIDIETLGTDPDKSPIISIGAVFFDLETGQIGEEFEVVLDLKEQLSKKRKVDANTLQWWLNQSDSAKKLFGRKGILVKDALKLFIQFIKKSNNPQPWGNGSTFDISFLESMLKENKFEIPWKFFNIMDLRTYVRFIGKGKKIQKIGVNHDALDDARSQAQYVIDNYRK